MSMVINDAAQLRAAQQVARAQRAIARYNELHTVYWRARAAVQSEEAALLSRQAYADLQRAQPLMLAIRQAATEAAQAAGWIWPEPPVTPWAGGPGRWADQAAGKRASLPDPVTITDEERRFAPERVRVKQHFNAVLAQARSLGKSGSWLPLRNAWSALRRLPADAARQRTVSGDV
jgi:hypothetical protein